MGQEAVNGTNQSINVLRTDADICLAIALRGGLVSKPWHCSGTQSKMP